MINYIISECSKLVQNVHKTRQEFLRKVIHKELCTNKWCMHNLESLLENEMHKILCDFEIYKRVIESWPDDNT